MLATAPDYRAAVEDSGVAFVPVGPGFAHYGGFEAVVKRIFDPRDGPEIIFREIVMPSLRQVHADLSAAAEGAALLVSHPLTVAMPIVAAQKKLPWVATVLAPISFMSICDPPVISGAEWFRGLRALGPRVYGALFGLIKLVARPWEKPLRAFRAELGLPPLEGMAMFEGQFSPYLNLGLFDPPLAAPQADWPARTRVTGAPLHDGAAPDADTSELDAFLAAGSPPLVFALGSSAIWVAGDDFWRSAAEASQRLGRRAILVAGAETAKRLRLPAEVRAFSYLPYSTVFPRAAAIIHQAGIGTLSQALRSGRPQLIVPFAFDQPDNARRAAALGCARVLPLKKISADSLTAELKVLLEQDQYAQRAAAVAAELRTVNGAARAADALCTLL